MKKHFGILTLILTFLISGCGQNADNTSNGNKEPSSGNIVSVSTEPLSKDISTSGALIDIAVGAYLATGEDHLFDFSFKEAENIDPQVYTSDESILQYVCLEGRHFLRAHKAGDAILYIKDNTGFTHYRNVVHVRDPLLESEVDDYLVSVDIWVGWGLGGTFTSTDWFTLTFLGDGVGIMQGVDAGINLGNIQFGYEYTSKAINGDYYFTVTSWQTDATTLSFVGFYLARTGDLLYGQMPDGYGGTATFEIFAPESL